MGEVVVFGPFVGELGWELLFWHGMVRRLCNTVFKNFRRIAVSMPGRQPFYPDVDEFLPLRDDDLPKNFSAQGYIADGWRDGLPGRPRLETYFHPRVPWTLLRHGIIQKATYIERWKGTPIEPRVISIIERLKSEFPSDSEFVTPFSKNRLGDATFGHDTSVNARMLEQASYRPAFDKQDLRRLVPSSTAAKAVEQLLDSRDKWIAVLPRKRDFRRPDKNWDAASYLRLIEELKTQGYGVILVGAPGGAHFVDQTVAGCIDLINIPNKHRLDLHIAAFSKSVAAIGGMSGAVLVALASGCPTVTFGHPEQQIRYYTENYLRTALVYLSTFDVSTADLIIALETLLGNSRLERQLDSR